MGKRVNKQKLKTYSPEGYVVYVLIKESKPIYIGVSKSLNERIEAHKRSKKFDGYVIVECYQDEGVARFHEKVLIDFGNKFIGLQNKTCKSYNHKVLL